MLKHLAELLYTRAGVTMPEIWWGRRRAPLVFTDRLTRSLVLRCWPDKYFFSLSLQIEGEPEVQLNLGPWERNPAYLLVSGTWAGKEQWFPVPGDTPLFRLGVWCASKGYHPELTMLLQRLGRDAPETYFVPVGARE